MVHKKGIEVGHIFKLGQKYSESMKAKITNKDSQIINMFMGCYGIGITRIVAAAIEQNNDDKGISWPKPLSPFDAVIIEIDGDKNIDIRKHSDDVYNFMLKNKIEIIYDDRNVSLGNKFKDWELIGVTNIIIIGKNESINKTVTYKNRKDETKEEMTIENMVNIVRD